MVCLLWRCLPQLAMTPADIVLTGFLIWFSIVLPIILFYALK
jgi:hypothetical protein